MDRRMTSLGTETDTVGDGEGVERTEDPVKEHCHVRTLVSLRGERVDEGEEVEDEGLSLQLQQAEVPAVE